MLRSMDPATQRIALVAGANGLVGGELLRVLANSGDYSRIIALTRRPLSFDAPRLVNRILRPASFEADLKGLACHEAYCCLGTTIAAAGSEAAFRAVDHDLVLRFAQFAKACGAQSFATVSSVGADPRAKNFYLRVKGETEAALQSQGWKCLHMLQPGLLLGSRREWRPLEFAAGLAMRVVNPLLLGQLMRYRAIDAAEVAAAMHGALRGARPGVHRHAGPALQALAAASRRTGRA
jgi:uncharacterized protein YbjT (DUF2867 family)